MDRRQGQTEREEEGDMGTRMRDGMRGKNGKETHGKETKVYKEGKGEESER